MDSALKQRLIGAAVLVALAVIFVPMLLEGPAPEDEAGSLPLTLPDAPARGYQTRELPLAPIVPANTAATVDAEGRPTGPTDDARLATVEAGGSPAPRVDELPLAQPTPGPAPAAAGEEAPPSPAPATAGPPPSMPVATTAPAPPAAAPPAPAATGEGRFAVNAGVYSNTANAQSLVAAFRQAGLPAYAESTTWQGRPAQRVRVGPYAMRAEAESARQRVRQVRSDVPTGVVALEGAPAAAGSAPAATAAAPTATPAPATPRAAATAGFAVQVGAFRSEGDANALRDRIRGAGFSALVERAQTDAGAVYRVRVGPAANRAEADRLRAQLSERLQLSGNVVPYP